jgi:hypothetical protein
VDMFIPCLLIVRILGGRLVSNQIVVIDSKDDNTDEEASLIPRRLKNCDTKQNPKAK